MASKKKDSFSERRHYIRLDTVIPVQFMLVDVNTKQNVTDWMQGFTNNISNGGLCLRVNNLKEEVLHLIRQKKVDFLLELDVPFSYKQAEAACSLAWVEDVEGEGKKKLIGLCYEKIAPALNRRIIFYARARRLFLPIIVSIIIILGLGLGLNTYYNYRLVQGNKALIQELVNILQESNIAKQKIRKINKEREDLQFKIQALEVRIRTIDEEKLNLKEKVEQQEQRAIRKTGELNQLVDKLGKEKANLQEQLIPFQQKENKVTEDLLRLEQKRVTLEKANLDKMYRWLTIHQNYRTGLVMSFEGDTDIANWGFIYDQALVIQAYAYFSDFERVTKILDFFVKKAKRSEGLFLNAYYVNDGTPAEYIVRSGPNIWLGISIIQYTNKSKDTRYLGLAEEIARRIIQIQEQDSEGGIRGGPGVDWYSTEHNLDAYAFFNMLYKITGKPEYGQAGERVLKWLLLHTYDKADLPILRGKGDSTIATDTYAWSIAAIGPQKLESLGMDPERIMDFAEQNCAVEVNFTRPQGQYIKIRGFDFAPQKHVARGGVVSSEWTAQMVLSFKIMSDYYHKKGMEAKAKVYDAKAYNYLLELCNMIISSPSPSGQGEGCLPYASSDAVDTGHGWMTPKGKYTGSVAGTTYTIFAYSNYNPLALKE
ncbi:MAG: hypothetical protein ABIG46_08085 [Candidatus Omnitrophota bacterium]|nr:hypothetical protein [Candidatus Omnitrophota bacterium]